MYKILVVCALLGFAAAATYKNPAQNYHHSNPHHHQQQQQYHHQQAHHQQARQYTSTHHAPSHDDVHAEVTLLRSDVRPDGYDYAVETTNGIHAQQSGDAHGNVHGDYFYTSPEGVPVKVSYVADENGYQPSSDLLPTPPPVPEAILKALEYIRTHPYHEEAHNNQGRHHGFHH